MSNERFNLIDFIDKYLNLVLGIFIILGFASCAVLGDAHAGLKDWCHEHLISDDPYPDAEASTDLLIRSLERRSEPEVIRELQFRFDAGMMSPLEIEAMMNALRGVRRE